MNPFPDPDHGAPERRSHDDERAEAELLERVLEELRSDSRATRTPAAGDGSPAAREWADFVTYLRASLAGEAEGAARGRRERALVERVLSRTTREDLSRWGDARLLVGFVAARLRGSVALRLLAASLLLHLLALPVVAWVVWVRPADAPRIGFELPAEPPSFAEIPREVPPEPSVPILDESAPSLRGAAASSGYVANSIRWARWMLAQGTLPAPPPMEGTDALDALLRQRLEILGGASPAAGPAAARGPLERALEAERGLDLLLVTGRVPAELELALLSLSPSARAGSDPDGPAGPEALLEACALARAEAYGVLPAAALPELAWARAEFPAAAHLLQRGEEARLVAPFDRAWCALLLRAADERLAPAWAASLGAR